MNNVNMEIAERETREAERLSEYAQTQAENERLAAAYKADKKDFASLHIKLAFTVSLMRADARKFAAASKKHSEDLFEKENGIIKRDITISA